MRIDLGGPSTPTPTEALPAGLSPDTLTPITTTFTEDGSFDKTVWTSFGYELFTIMCVGAAGGRGSFAWYMLGGGPLAPLQLVTCGGAGGGGGMHIVSGLLADLSDISAIVVGQAGADAEDAQPGYSPYPISYNHHGIDVGDPGGDGGYSSFAGTVCRASGGKGGEVSPVVVSASPNTSWKPGGDGGDGGKGGQTTPGGGAAGGVSTLLASPHTWDMSEGEQGFFNTATGIGEGGGGGVGFTAGGSGVGQDAAWITDVDTGGFLIQSVHDVDGSEGGRGSFNYADSTKHGARQTRPVKSWSTEDFNIYSPHTYTAPLPGGGGGGRPTPLAKYGSYAEGYSPNGLVIVRVA
jgi:hypothetical protein